MRTARDVLGRECEYIMKRPYAEKQHVELLEWLNTNTTCIVKVKIVNIRCFGDETNSANWYVMDNEPGDHKVLLLGFESSNDALFFRIQYPI